MRLCHYDRHHYHHDHHTTIITAAAAATTTTTTMATVGAAPLDQSLLNLSVDLGALVVGIFLLRREGASQTEALDRVSCVCASVCPHAYGSQTSLLAEFFLVLGTESNFLWMLSRVLRLARLDPQAPGC